MEPQQFEFSPAQNQFIGKLASKMLFVGRFYMLVGVVLVIRGLFRMLGVGKEGLGFDAFTLDGLDTLLLGVILLFIGINTRHSARSFKRVVESSGSDVTNLLGALENLERCYAVQYWLLVLAIILIVVAFIAVSITHGPASPARKPHTTSRQLQYNGPIDSVS